MNLSFENVGSTMEILRVKFCDVEFEMSYFERITFRGTTTTGGLNDQDWLLYMRWLGIVRSLIWGNWDFHDLERSLFNFGIFWTTIEVVSVVWLFGVELVAWLSHSNWLSRSSLGPLGIILLRKFDNLSELNLLACHVKFRFVSVS